MERPSLTPNSVAMDHSEAVSMDAARRFCAGRLAGDDLERFEIHLLSCQECQRDVAADDGLRTGMRTAGEVGASQTPRRKQYFRPVALAASVALAVSTGLIGYQLGNRPVAPDPVALPVVSITLDSVRAAEAQHVLELPADRSTVVIRAVLSATDPGRYSLELRDASGRVVGQARDVSFDPTSDPAVSIAIDSSALTRGTNYALIAAPRETDTEAKIDRLTFAVR
jgi:hypothetical protein